ARAGASLRSCAFILHSEVGAVSSGQCNVPARSRENCGYPGIGEIECSARQCCFDSNVIDAPWCFKPISIEESCI
uniref:P-type domain-containing protein n=1 Tax=Podarcis muralis TaxID=64176 RepID=A0A670KB63_PODMU